MYLHNNKINLSCLKHRIIHRTFYPTKMYSSKIQIGHFPKEVIDENTKSTSVDAFEREIIQNILSGHNN